MEAIKTGMLPLMWLSPGIIAGVSLFGISLQVPFAKDLGFGPLIAASSAGVLAIVNGTGRDGRSAGSPTGSGRKQTRSSSLLVIGRRAVRPALRRQGAQRGRCSCSSRSSSGFGGGAFYPMFAALIPDYFGENNNATNYGLIYSSKLVSGLFGGGLGAVVIGAWDYTGAYTLAGVMGLVSAVMRCPAPAGTPEGQEDRAQPLSDQQGDHVIGSGPAQHPGMPPT